MEQGGNALVRPIIFSFRRAFCISRRSYVDLSRRPLMPASLVSDISSWLLRINLPRPCSASEHRRLHLTRFDLVKKAWKRERQFTGVAKRRWLPNLILLFVQTCLNQHGNGNLCDLEFKRLILSYPKRWTTQFDYWSSKRFPERVWMRGPSGIYFRLWHDADFVGIREMLILHLRTE